MISGIHLATALSVMLHMEQEGEMMETSDNKRWWEKAGMDIDVDNGAWLLHQAAEYLPGNWKHIVSSASSLVLCANRKDSEGVKQFLQEISDRVGETSAQDEEKN